MLIHLVCISRLVLLVRLGPHLVVRLLGRWRVEGLLIHNLLVLLHRNEHWIAPDLFLVYYILAIRCRTSPSHDDLRHVTLRVHRSFHALWLLHILHAEIHVLLRRVLILVWHLSLTSHCDG